MMLSEICAEVKNYFCDDADKQFGEFTIEGGSIAPPFDFLKDGQYFAIFGSTFNDGVHQWPVSDLTDETFDGAIWPMKVPADFVTLCGEIKAYAESDAAKPTAYVSESFGGYSYSKATNADGSPMGWQGTFKSRLDRYRRARL